MRTQDVLLKSGRELALHIQNKDLSSVELTRLYLDRIASHNPDLQAFVRYSKKRSLLNAKRADQQLARKGSTSLPPFHGVPFGIKDLVPTLGVPTHLGSRAFRYFVPPFSGPVVNQFRKAGFISLGKLATSEFGIMPVTEPDLRPPTRNPWNRNHSSGGSSGGSSSAVASGLLPCAHASDGGGSIRIPASLCHLFGMKPSLAWSGNLHGPVNKLGLATMGSVTKTVEDAALIQDILARADMPSCARALEQPPPSLRVHMCTQSPVMDVAPEIQEAVYQAAKVLEKMGHQVIECSPLEASISEFLPIWAYVVAQVPSPSERLLQPVSRWLRKMGRDVSLEEAKALQEKFCAQIDSFFGEADIVLTPTVGVSPPKVGAYDLPDPKDSFYEAAVLGSFTILANLMHAPAASIPYGLDSHGLPIGIQIGGRPLHDPLVFAVAKQLEHEMPWRHRVAPGFF